MLITRILINPDNEAIFDIAQGQQFSYRALNDRTKKLLMHSLVLAYKRVTKLLS